jgi:signal transduction histidine kinase
MARRLRWVTAFIRRAESGGVAPWGLAFDAAVAVTAAAGAVLEVAQHEHSVHMSGARVSEVGRLLAVTPLHPGTAALAAAAMTALPLAFRRCYPVGAWLVIAAALVSVHWLFQAGYVPPVAAGTAIYAAYSAVAHSRYRYRALAAVAGATVAIVALVDGSGSPKVLVVVLFAFPPAVAAGLGTRKLLRRLANSAANLRRADAEARAATEAALAAERSRIAAELHDVVTHNVSVMIVSAGAARKILSSSPADAEDALLTVEATGREAMTELRNLLGLLSPRTDGLDGPVAARGADTTGNGGGAAAFANSGAFTPQPGLGELDTLVGRVSAAGLQVKVDMHGEPRPLPPGADLAAYRVVQEGLTNVLRHAGQATAAVAIDWREDLIITVTDDGRLEPGGPPGRGLLGLRERLALYGATLTAGSQPGGGWQLRVVMPVPDRSTR